MKREYPPIVRLTERLVEQAEKAVRGFSCNHKYTLEAEQRQQPQPTQGNTMYKLIIATLLLTISSTNYAACSSAITRTAPDSRYELLNSNTEVKDKQTGLIWQRCSIGQTWSVASCTGDAVTHIWATALQTAKSMGNGWRVPNVKELDSLIEQSCDNPSINDIFFPNTVSSRYWSSSPSSSNGAWIVNFGDGYGYGYIKSGNSYMRLVRSGQ